MEYIMSTIDITFCGELIKRVGTRLYEISKREAYASSVDVLLSFYQRYKIVYNV